MSLPFSKLLFGAGAALSTFGLACELDERYSIKLDIGQIIAGQKSKKYWEQLCLDHGEHDWSFYHVLHKTHNTNDTDEAFLFEARSWTYGQVRAEIGRLALALQQMGIRNRTVVAMFINNSPEFYFVWWALFKIGAIPAPLNTSISQQPFLHCLRVCEAEYLITSFELYETLASSLALETSGHLLDGAYSNGELPQLTSISVYNYDTYPVCPVYSQIKTIAQNELPPTTRSMAEWPAAERPRIRSSDISQYLFTSGTTGLPKAAQFPASFAQMAANTQKWPVMFKKKRRVYLCPPMFHGGATYALLPATVAAGGTIILARRFSVRNFWHDMRRTRANMIFHIGEMARYLVQAPVDPIHKDERTTHDLEIMYGMGMAGPVWKAFRERFGVPWVVEYYGATEGTTLISYSNRSDSGERAKVAHWGPLMRHLNDVSYIVRVDNESGEIVRDPKTGFCIKAEFDEIGEAINRIRPPLQQMHEYVGPTGEADTEKKLLRDVFEKGDLFVRLGDALSMDRRGYITFQDRLGDTFRNKGHNISTAEVENAFLNHDQITSANVYAIRMTEYGYDGQVGCAAINLRGGAKAEAGKSEQETMNRLEDWLKAKGGLPSYAVPRFVRVLVDASGLQHGLGDDVRQEQVSPIMKKMKTELRKQAFMPPSASADRMYWIEKEGRGFVPLESAVREDIRVGKAKL